MSRRQTERPPARGWLAALVALAFAGLLGDSLGAAGPEGGDWRHDGAGFEEVEDPAQALFELPQPWPVLADRGRVPEELLDEVVSVHHEVPIGGGETLRINEHFTLRSWLRWPKRAVLFLGSSARATYWSIPVPGYNGTAMAARRGMFAFTLDYLGVGENYRPGGDALESTFEANQEVLRAVLRYIRFFRAVAEVDLVGEAWGGAHATRLAADDRRVRSVVLSSMTYKRLSRPELLAPEFVAMLRTLPDNYLPVGPEFYAMVTVGAPEAVIEYTNATQPGLYLTTPIWQMVEGLPFFDPSVARVPGLVISGTAESADGRELAADYGTSGAELFVIEGAGHVPRVEAPEKAELYWKKIWEFLDPEAPASEPVAPQPDNGDPSARPEAPGDPQKELQAEPLSPAPPSRKVG